MVNAARIPPFSGIKCKVLHPSHTTPYRTGMSPLCYGGAGSANPNSRDSETVIWVNSR
jgi:hypothetical protein